jgi:hypothetical protein
MRFGAKVLIICLAVLWSEELLAASDDDLSKAVPGRARPMPNFHTKPILFAPSVRPLKSALRGNPIHDKRPARALWPEVCERMRRDGGSVFPAHANTGDPNGPLRPVR